MSKAAVCLYIGGALHVGWAGFHLLFPWIFKWKTALGELDTVNRNIYQILNLCLTFFFALVAYLSLGLAPLLLKNVLGGKLLAGVTAFWLLRFGLQLRFFKAGHPLSLLLNVLFLLTMAMYAYPMLNP